MATAYRVNAEKKIITINDSVKATPIDEKDIALYVNAGYVIKHKSKKRSEQNDGLTDAIIKEDLKENKAKLKEYEGIKKERGFFAAKSWYKKNK